MLCTVSSDPPEEGEATPTRPRPRPRPRPRRRRRPDRAGLLSESAAAGTASSSDDPDSLMTDARRGCHGHGHRGCRGLREPAPPGPGHAAATPRSPATPGAAGAALARAGSTAPVAAQLSGPQRARYEIEGEMAAAAWAGCVAAHESSSAARSRSRSSCARPGRTRAARSSARRWITARLQHPAIVPVYEAGRWPDGEPFYAMKLVDGPLARAASSPRRATLDDAARAAAPRDRGRRGDRLRAQPARHPPRPQAGQRPGRRRSARPSSSTGAWPRTSRGRRRARRRAGRAPAAEPASTAAGADGRWPAR